MTRLLRHLTPYSHAMMAGILVLAGIIVMEVAFLDFTSATMTVAGEGDAAESADSATSAPEVDAVSIPPLPTYRELQARPLFMETRRPAPRQAGATAARRVDPGTKWKLTGIVVAGEDSHVFVQGIRDKAVRRLDMGQILDGWVISEITPQYVILIAGDEESRLELRQEADET